MILVDTSVWIEFLRIGNPLLTEFLEKGQVYTHPLVIGELSVGNISKRNKFLNLLNDLPSSKEATHQEVITFIDLNKTFEKGVGYFDHMILCSAIITDCPLWTLDKKLMDLAKTYHSALARG